jgi:hypothetical protein
MNRCSWLRFWKVGLALMGLIAVTAGCSSDDKRLTVKGTVTIDGQPVTQGRVQFYGPNNQFSTAGIDPDGTFIATDVIPGDLRVAVVDPSTSVKLPPPSEKDSSASKSTRSAPKSRTIPAKYQNADTSGLVYNITPASAQIEIKMSSK